MMDESWNDIPLYTIYQNNIRKLRPNCGVTGQLIIYRTYSIVTQSLYSFNRQYGHYINEVFDIFRFVYSENQAIEFEQIGDTTLQVGPQLHITCYKRHSVIL